MDKLEVTQNITVDNPTDFNSTGIVNTDAIQFVTTENLKTRTNFNADCRTALSLTNILSDKNIIINANKPFNIYNLIDGAIQTQSSIDIVDTNGNILKKVFDINDILFNENIITYILNNIDNDFYGNELDNYINLKNSQVPVIIENNKDVSIEDTIILNKMLISLNDIN